jgi:hypothetical protein
MRQLAASVQTLRWHNAAIPVVLFVHGDMTDELAAICSEYDVIVHDQGSYEQRLARHCPRGWSSLASYPLLHKYLNFRELATLEPKQVLCCDCDTVFFDDVEILFDRYSAPDVVAREEVHSSRSPFGSDLSFIDEPLLAHLAASEQAAWIPPFNIGVVLFNNDVWRAVADLEQLFVDYAWRFVTWMAHHPATGVEATWGEFSGVAAARVAANGFDLARCLPYPSQNRWIVDEVALWLALGHIGGLRTADFHPSDLAQNGEFTRSNPERAGWILCHYYSQNMGLINEWLRSTRAHGNA